MNTNLFFQPQQSILYRGYLILTHVFALLCIGSLVPEWLLIFLLLIATGSFYHYFFRDQNITALKYDKKTEWILHYVNDSMERGNLLPSSVMMRYFLILHFKGLSNARIDTIVLFSDSFSSKDFQALRRCVRMGFL
ncbi:MAG: hypothetical protein A3F13_09755 [Gammaproteobacteria bacterium RIFCSPHIGHO2_12_FULL_40_19]|nr:MAG: hypothetical protein A3F13_09755 [Gammaproteobacteria bacterium RIFCSPHIGHO2_12_FULL_40_19]